MRKSWHVVGYCVTVAITLVIADMSWLHGVEARWRAYDKVGYQKNVLMVSAPQLQFAGPAAHDPTMAYDGKQYYLYTTGPGIPASRSKDLREWEPVPKVFPSPQQWGMDFDATWNGNVWAPNIARYHDKWLMFYAISRFGKNESAIGLAISKSLDPSSRNYHWDDHGIVVQTHRGDNWNAIDPNFTIDANGSPFLAAGSFWSGIKLFKLDSKSLKPLDAEHPIALASRPNTPEIQGSIEAPFLQYRGGWYYLFASYDFCCRGANSTYNVRVGRSRSILGPFVDLSGKRMLEGGGTQILFPDERWKGPGHCCICRNAAGVDQIVYHAYDAQNNGLPRLQVRELNWGADGWPSVQTPNQTSNSL